MDRNIWLGGSLVATRVLSLALPHALVGGGGVNCEPLVPPTASDPQRKKLPPVLRRSLQEARGHLVAGRFREALSIYEFALAAAEEHSEEHARARLTVFTGQGLAYKKLGDYHQALLLYQEALRLARRDGDRGDIARLLRNVGSCYTSLGEFELARDAFEEVLEGHASRHHQSLVLADLGTLLNQERQYDEALRLLDRALVLRWGVRDTSPETRRRSLAMILDRMGSAAWNAGQLPRAERAYESSRLLLRQGSLGPRLAIIESNLGRLHLELGAPQKALALLQPAQRVFKDHALPLEEAVALQGIAEAHRRQGKLEMAAHDLERALALAEELRSSAINPHLRSMFLASHRKFYDLAIQIAMSRFAETSEETFLHRALVLSERAKGRSLLDLLQEGPRLPRRVEDSDLEAQLRFLEVELNSLEHQRLALVQRLASLAEIAEIEKKQRALILANEDAWNALRMNLQEPDLPDLPRIQALLDPKTRFLVYSLGEEKSFLWLVGLEGIKAWPLPGRERINSLAERAWRALTLSDQLGGSELESLEELGALLLPFDSTHLTDQRLVVVPEGILHAIPFAALTHPRTGEPLVQHHEIVQLPSLAALEVLRRREAERPPKDGLVAVIYDPIHSPRDPRWKGPLPSPDLPRWPRLGNSAREAEAILSRAPAAHSLGITGFEARREALHDGRLSRFQIVHLGVHGELDEERPELSSLVLSQIDAEGRPLDGQLFMHEIDDLELPAELVVLSACNSARGRLVRGEGLVGLTRAMFLAGANRTLVSLWSVNDEATAELMTAFYEALLVEGLPPPRALRAAQQKMLASKRWGAPYYWAAFVFQGDWNWHLSTSAEH